MKLLCARLIHVSRHDSSGAFDAQAGLPLRSVAFDPSDMDGAIANVSKLAPNTPPYASVDRERIAARNLAVLPHAYDVKAVGRATTGAADEQAFP